MVWPEPGTAAVDADPRRDPDRPVGPRPARSKKKKKKAGASARLKSSAWSPALLVVGRRDRLRGLAPGRSATCFATPRP